MHEHAVEVYRTARYYSLGAELAGERGVQEAWVVCHGYGQLARYFLRHFRPLQRSGRLVVAPEGLSRFYMDDGDGGGTYERVGASWMTRDAREAEIADHVRWLDTAYSDALSLTGTPRPERLIALGFSQGGATVTRWLARSAMLPPHRCHRLVLWGSALPHDLDLGAHRVWLDGRLLLVAGTEDPFATPERIAEAENRLRGEGIRFERLTFEGGHRLDAEVLRQIAAADGLP